MVSNKRDQDYSLVSLLNALQGPWAAHAPIRITRWMRAHTHRDDLDTQIIFRPRYYWGDPCCNTLWMWARMGRQVWENERRVFPKLKSHQANGTPERVRRVHRRMPWDLNPCSMSTRRSWAEAAVDVDFVYHGQDLGRLDALMSADTRSGAQYGLS
jgi:hypothetical protein